VVGLREQGRVEQLGGQDLNTDEPIITVKVEMDRGPDVLGSDDARLDHVHGLQADVHRIRRAVVAEAKHRVVGHGFRLPAAECRVQRA
jgi:hypothetical protein